MSSPCAWFTKKIKKNIFVKLPNIFWVLRPNSAVGQGLLIIFIFIRFKIQELKNTIANVLGLIYIYIYINIYIIPRNFKNHLFF